MGLFGPNKPKRVTKAEFEEIRTSLFSDLDRDEWMEVQHVFYGHLMEEGVEAGITKEEFEQGMQLLRDTRAYSRLEASDLEAIETEFLKHLDD